MKRSSDRILTTHAGSLCRPTEIAETLRATERGKPIDEAEFEQMLTPAVADVVRRQAEVGIDVPSDGEFGKSTWMGYVAERLSGVETIPEDAPRWEAGEFSKDMKDFAEFYEIYNRESGSQWLPPEIKKRHPNTSWMTAVQVACTGPLSYTGHSAIQRDIANLKTAMQQVGAEEACLPLAAPASVESWVANQHYHDDETYLEALADVLREEYRAVVDAGLILQIDDAFIPSNYDHFLLTGTSMQEYRRYCSLRIEALNEALRDIPRDRVRYHICWGSWAGPHTTDVPLSAILDLVLRVNAQAYVVEAANPRHEHEWRVWEDVDLPEGTIVIPGVVTHSTNVVEHPETIAERLERYASAVGRENLMAGTDCGFSQGWNMPRTHPTVQWAKLQALADGAKLASERLWNRTTLATR